MKILMLHPHEINSLSEPWTVRIVYIAREFAKRGHQVKLVYFPLQWNGQKPQKLEDGITIIPFSRKLGTHTLISNVSKLYSLAADVDVIHFQKCFYHAALPAIVVALLKRKPLHYDWDDWEFKIYEASTQPGILRDIIGFFINTFEIMIPKIADTVSCASHALKNKCERLGVREGRIFDAHVGADLESFHPGVSGENVRKRYNIGKPLILYLGQLHGGQYAELFIQAASKIINEHKEDLTFMIVGDGYRAEELKRLAYAAGLNGRLIFAGAVSHDLIPQYIAAADVCVACFEENDVTICKSPLKIAEYLASGKAIVASDVGEVRNMVGEAGILAVPGDGHSLALSIIRIVKDNDLKKKLERVARRQAECIYNWGTTAENILRAYSEAMKRK
jgi:glycosyltransferase involved in cell wall biosynthesis